MDEKVNSHDLLIEVESLRKELRSLTQTKNDLLIYNKRFEKIFGIKSEGLMESLPTAIFDPELTASTQDYDRPVLDSGEAEQRRVAEARLQAKNMSAAELPIVDAQKILHELEVHKIELEMQNEWLLEARDTEQLALHRYTGLFDFAPIGYFILDPTSEITQVNLKGENLLGIKRSNLFGRRFLVYIALEYRVTFCDFLANVFDSGDKQNCEILVQVGKHDLWLSVEANIEVSATECLVAMIDITDRKQAEDELRKNNALFSQAEAMGNMGHFCWDLVKDKLISCSDQFASIYGKTVPEALDCFTSTEAVMNLIHPDDKEHFRQNTYFYKEVPKGNNIEYRITISGGTRYIYVRRQLAFDDDGKPSQLFGTVLDITERKLAQNELNIIYELPSALIMVVSEDHKIVHSSAGWEMLLGLTKEELEGETFTKFIHADDVETTISKANEVHKGLAESNFENRFRSKDGSYKTLSWSASVDVDTGNRYGCAIDVTERKQTERKLERLAHYDVLTDLPNRVLLADRLSQAMVQCHRRNQSLAVAYLDLDGFKVVNDTYGHDLGDRLLVELSKHMKEALREGDSLARIGGDEFIAIMVDLEKIEDSEPVLKRLLKAAAKPVTLGDAVMQVSASIGVTLYPQDGADADQLIRHADEAMYVAKHAGKNHYHLFDTAQNNAINIRGQSIADVRSAMERREFVLHYQPKVNMHTGDVIGVEALIRWQHPDRGLVPPLDFLPAIEGHAISLELGEWVIDTALSQISQWRNLGVNLPISVNISAYQLQQNNFAARLPTLLAAHPEVDPHYLELEILESSVLSDIGQVFDTMSACHDLGVRFALDDFGTGYSSLTHIKRLPAYLIKIDQSFVRDMLEDIDDLAIVEGVVGLAKTFKREVIAEGVETIAHGVALLELGCELAQGYGIARPMPADDIPEWVSNWKADDSWQVKSAIE